MLENLFTSTTQNPTSRIRQTEPNYNDYQNSLHYNNEDIHAELNIASYYLIKNGISLDRLLSKLETVPIPEADQKEIYIGISRKTCWKCCHIFKFLNSLSHKTGLKFLAVDRPTGESSSFFSTWKTPKFMQIKTVQKQFLLHTIQDIEGNGSELEKKRLKKSRSQHVNILT